MSETLLSICLCGRNDDYGVDFKRRFVQSMNFLAWSAEKAGLRDKIEVVFCDWNSEVPLASCLTFSDAATEMLRFIEVPPEVAKPLNYGKTPFHTSKSLNAAFRRAKGKYIAMMPADILLTRYSLLALFAILEERVTLPFSPKNTLMLVPRKMLAHPVNDIHFFDTDENIEKILTLSDYFIENDKLAINGFNGGAGVFLLAAELIRELRGVDESIGGWGSSDIDIALRASSRTELVRLSGFGVISYDFAPVPQTLNVKKERFITFESSRNDIQVNDENWGLGQYVFNETHPQSGVFPKSLPPISPDILLREELLERLSHIYCYDCPFCSALTFAAVSRMIRNRARKVLILGLECDPSIGISISMSDPLTAFWICDGKEKNINRFNALIWQMRRRVNSHIYEDHQGVVNFIANELPDRSLCEHFDLIVSASGFLPENPGGLLSDKGELLSLRKQELPGYVEYCSNGVLFYTKTPFCKEVADLEWRKANGNPFTPLWDMLRRPYSWRALFGRLSLNEWRLALKILWRQSG